MARRFAQRAVVAACNARERPQALEVEPRIVKVLPGGEPAQPFDDDVGGAGERGSLGLEIGEAFGPRGMGLGLAGSCSRRTLAGGGKPRRKTAQIGLDRLAVGADRRLERFDRHRQAARCGDRAEHHRIDHGAGFASGGIHVEQDRLARIFADLTRKLLDVEAAVAHRHLLGDAVRAMGRGDGERAVRRDEACRGGAGGLQQFARHHDIDVADVPGDSAITGRLPPSSRHGRGKISM
jgi:hypothetical protein